MSVKFSLLCGVAGSAMMVGAAQAATVELAFDGSTPFGTPALYETLTVKYGLRIKSVDAGLLRLVNTDTGQKVLAFCADVTKWITNPGTYAPAPGVVSGTIQSLFNTAYSTVNTATEAAGFQLALWEIIHETTAGSYNLSSGYFKVQSVSASTLSYANSYLAGLTGSATGNYDLTYLDSYSVKPAFGQDLIGVAPVPLPATALLLGGAVAGMAGLRRRKAVAA